jgi:2-oxoglutarate dehydrogenase E2 component (dihydrolipoamide succinyltransferase)
MKPLLTLLAAASLLASAGMAPAEPARSLNDARSQINSGTWPGITLIEAKPKAEPPASAASAAPVAAVPVPAAAATAGTAAKATATPVTAGQAQAQAALPATVAPVAAVPAPAVPAPAAPAPAAATTPAATAAAPTANSPSVAERLRAVLGPPSGVPMNQATRLDSPDQGIVLPTGTAAAASGAAK